MPAKPTTTATVAAPHPGGDRSSPTPRRLLAALAVTQTVGYGVLYYAFAVILTPMAAALHTSNTTVTGALAVAVIVTGLAAIPVGRWIDHHGAHTLMTIGSILGTIAVAVWANVHTVTQLYVVFVGIGIASAMVLYEPAFAVIVQTVPAARRNNALLTVTIVAGFASSIFLPTAGWLNAHLGWRHALLALAATYLILTVPLHALTIPRRHRRPPMPNPASSHTDPTRLRDAVTDAHFWLLAAAFTLQAAAVAVISVHLVAYLIHLGHPPAIAATIAGLLGILSVTGRLITSGLTRRHPMGRITAGVFLIQAAGAAALPLVGRSLAGAIACVTVFGIGFGVATIARPAILADRYNTHAYATIAGATALPINAAKAVAPLAAAAIAATHAGYTTVMALVAISCAAAAAGMFTEARTHQTQITTP